MRSVIDAHAGTAYPRRVDIGHIFSSLGPWAVAIGAGLEGEAAAITAGVLVHRHLLPPVGAWLVIAFGAFVVDEIFFFLGRRCREREFVRRMHAKPAFAKAMAFIERFPNAYIFVFRFLYGLRTVSPIAIGLTRIGARRFVILNALAALIWAGIFVAVGYAFGPAVDHALKALAPYKTELMIAFPIPGTCLLIWWLWRRRRNRRRDASQPAPSIEAIP